MQARSVTARDAEREAARASAGSRYTIFGQIGAGGMATIQYAEVVGPSGFSRPVAIKRLHAHLAGDANFAALFLDEARLSARIAHANVVATLDVLSHPGEISVVMEYIHGESLAGLLSIARARDVVLPCLVASNLIVGVLHGLHAAHETTNELGEPLGIVHRDVSPENILVGSDGIPRLLDFGIAKAKGRARVTPSGELKGKLSYMAPEQYDWLDIDRRVDVYGASVVLWQALTGRMLFDGPSDAAIVQAVMSSEVPAPSQLRADVPAALDRLVMRGLSRERDQRFSSAREMALALEREVGTASQSEVCDWLCELAGELLEERALMLQELRRQTQRVGKAGTRRIPQGRVAGGEPADFTRLAGGAGQELTRAVTSDEAPLAARSRTRRRRPARPLLALIVLLALVGAASASWLAFRLHEAPPMPTKTVASLQPRARARDLARSAEEPNRPATLAAPTPILAEPEPAAPPIDQPKKERKLKREPQFPAKAREARPARAARPRDCTQPYEIDGLGIRRWKRECL
jgi:serine/threonine-protein kinase